MKSIIWCWRKGEEVQWSANVNLQNDIHMQVQSLAISSGALASSIVWLACVCQGRPKMNLALRAGGVLLAAPPVTDAGEPKTWLVKILRREFWPEVFSSQLFYRHRLFTNCSNHEPCWQAAWMRFSVGNN
jgi:hypothetical protein